MLTTLGGFMGGQDSHWGTDHNSFQIDVILIKSPSSSAKAGKHEGARHGRFRLDACAPP